jgi:AraC family transcriptional regulator, regulatory protein of adaptative response / DNA-3-methyladenine glycosylase II
MLREFGSPPSAMRRAPAAQIAASDPSLVLRLRMRPPFDADAVGEFLAARTVEGLEQHGVERGSWTHRRVVPLGAHSAVAEVRVVGDHVVVRSDTDIRGTAALVRRVRRWLDLDADPETIDAALADDPALRPLVAARPGLRVLTTVDPWETVVRAIVGQQVSVAGARTILARIVAEFGSPISPGLAGFPGADVLTSVSPDDISVLGMPRARGRTIHAAATAVADGRIDLRGSDPASVREALLELPGIGPWTADYVRLRALADPDAFPVADLGLRHAAVALGLPDDPRGLSARAESWSPWRSYAAQHLWTSAPPSSARAPRRPVKETS